MKSPDFPLVMAAEEIQAEVGTILMAVEMVNMELMPIMLVTARQIRAAAVVVFGTILEITLRVVQVDQE